ncbi:MAG: DNA recombination protein RmuC, partial [Cloacibacillus sp.]
MPLLLGIGALLILAGIYIVMSLSRFREGAGAMEQTARELLTRLQKMESRLDDSEERVGSALAQMRKEQRESAIDNRNEQTRNIGIFGDAQARRIKEIGDMQRESLTAFSGQLTDISRLNEEKLEAVRDTVEKKLSELYKSNEEKLEKMRATVDEQLHSTLE